ncbi:hypothetical protein F5Y16DRAFT_424673 [Xylariaceae sp. FL0255]|nr:hypothetical protein F5Y16DRAFT_424673 [Xylariaceae sp. FL0255]
MDPSSRDIDDLLQRLSVRAAALKQSARSCPLHPRALGSNKPIDEQREQQDGLIVTFQKSVTLLELETGTLLQQGPPQQRDLASLYASLHAVEQADREVLGLKRYLDTHSADEKKEALPENRRDADCASDERLGRLRRHIDSVQKCMEEYRTHIRHSTEVISRSSQRPLSILDLPDELLLMVFRNIRGNAAWDLAGSTFDIQTLSNIQNARLTCRRFLYTSSPFLFGFLTFDISARTLSDLKTLSEHPVLYKSICSVELNLNIYHADMVRDIRSFASICARKLRREERDSYHPTWTDLSSAEWYAQEALGKAVSTAWEQFSLGGHVSPEHEVYIEDLKTGYEELLRHSEEQQRLIDDKSFAQSFGEALAKMPRIQKLIFADDDEDQQHWKIMRKRIGASRKVPMNSFRNGSMVVYVGPREAYIHGQPIIPLDIPILVLSAMSQYRSSVDSLAFHFFDGGVGSNSIGLVPDSKAVENLRLFAKQLKSFTFVMSYFDTDSSLTEIQRDIHMFFSPLLSGRSLEELLLHYHSNSHTPLLMTFQERPNLSVSDIEDVALHESELRRIFGPIRKTTKALMSDSDRRGKFGVRIRLSFARLLSGSWASVLDLLRGHVTRDSLIHSPSGGECDTMSSRDYKRIFKPAVLGMRTLAELYIQNCDPDAINPLRVNSTTNETGPTV